MAHHHHHHCHEGSCDVSSCPCSCHKHHCCGHHHECHEHGNFAHELIEMADEAWMEVLKEKIKAQVIALNGKNLDELAKVVAETNNARWKAKMSKQKRIEDFDAKIDEFCKKD